MSDSKQNTDIKETFPHCILKDGYFDSILNRIERNKAKSIEKSAVKTTTSTEITLLQSNQTLILEVEKWDVKTSIY